MLAAVWNTLGVVWAWSGKTPVLQRRDAADVKKSKDGHHDGGALMP
jgi:hypothetical protein